MPTLINVPTISIADKLKVRLYLQEAELQTPITPMLAKAFMLLQNLII